MISHCFAEIGGFKNRERITLKNLAVQLRQNRDIGFLQLSDGELLGQGFDGWGVFFSDGMIKDFF